MVSSTIRTVLSIAIPIGVLVIAGALWFNLRGQRRAHRVRHADSSLSPEDQTYYERQHRRRMAGIVLMAIIGAALLVDSLLILPPFNPQHRVRLLWFWTITMALVLGMIIVAVVDILAIWDYARRHRRAIRSERQRLIDDYRRARAQANPERQPGDGRDSADGRRGPNGSSPPPAP